MAKLGREGITDPKCLRAVAGSLGIDVDSGFTTLVLRNTKRISYQETDGVGIECPR